ncbi:MAG: TonB-dependent receptor [Gammaproteobacteria bacterium]|nr:TonB-dependent receptor [Gammaproteobacteria bacterium]MCY4199882.1 TonB-dependent receptor [Gammaproteobacteria bacterium]
MKNVMMSAGFRNFRKLAAALGLVALPLSASAAPIIEEIIVVAQKREQNAQEVPISITALSGSALEQQGLSDISQIGEMTPNLEMDNTSPFAGSSSVLSPFIRGIGQNDFAFNLEPGVGVYVDGVYYARTIGAVVDLLDLERVEVLSGPQGTLFGRNSIGGVLNIITRRPAEEFTYALEATTGDYDRLDVRGSIDAPLIDGSLLSQFAFSSKQRDGYQDRIEFPGNFVQDVTRFVRASDETGGSQGGQDQINLRGKLLWSAGDELEITFAGDYSENDEDAPATSLIEVGEGNGLAGLYNLCINTPPAVLAAIAPVCTLPLATTGAVLAGVNVDDDPNNNRLPINDRYILSDIDKSYAEGSNFSQVKTWGLTTTIDWGFAPTMNMKSITAYRELDAIMGADFDGGMPFVAGDASFDTQQEQLSQEFQITGLALNDQLDWLLGAYYFYEEGGLTDYVPLLGGLIQVLGPNQFENTAYALFTHVSYAMTDRWSTTFGVRYTKEDKEFEGGQRDLNMFPARTGFPAAGHPDPNDLTRIYPLGVHTKDYDDVSLKLGVEYRLSEATFAYASYAEGFKSGGWTTRLLVPETPNPNVAPDFDEEQATSYELGIKSQLLDNRLQLNGAVFFTDYENIQVTVQRGVSPTFDNAGDGEIQGAELGFVALPAENWSVTGSIGYIDAEYTDLDPLVDPNLTADDKFVNTPDWATHLAIEYSVPLSNGSELQFHVDHSYKSEIANDAVNTPSLVADSVNLYHAHVSYVTPSQDLTITLGGRNLSDERYIYSGFAHPIGFTSANYSRPREWYLTFRYSPF